ncbi:MAG: hypothetical protein CM15mP120_19730 [Pseudomonadota bacterium]|nr:MAG: hypothetical protein CM15mP120_19730 [Pseudomonadota bacterium]
MPGAMRPIASELEKNLVGAIVAACKACWFMPPATNNSNSVCSCSLVCLSRLACLCLPQRVLVAPGVGDQKHTPICKTTIRWRSTVADKIYLALPLFNDILASLRGLGANPRGAMAVLETLCSNVKGGT